jgi:glycerophosphoryl diester phosphodiesterase
LDAFERALALGADGVELDVRLSRDGVVMVLHDPDLARITEGRDSRAVADLSAQELGQIELNRGARIPTLHEVLSWATGRGALLNVELKSDAVPLRPLARAVHRTCCEAYPDHGPKLVLSSFHVGLLMYLKALGTKHEFAWLTRRQQTYVKGAPLAALLGMNGVHPEHPILEECRVNHWHRQDLFVGAWTVNSEEDIRLATTLGADVLISDDPELARNTVS